MGFRFRKIFAFGPLRSTWTGRGLGWSIGFPGLRLGIAADGRSYFSLGIPGTGLYYLRHFSRKKR